MSAAGHDVGQRPGLGRLGIARLVVVHRRGAALVDDALAVGDEGVLLPQSQIDQQVEAGQRRRTGAGADQLHVLDPLADDLQAVDHGRRRDDGGAVLVVVEDRDLHPLAKLRLDVEAFRRLDVFQVDAAEGRLQARDDLDQLFRVGLVDLDVEHVDPGELLEQAALAFHDRLARQGADIAQAQHGGPVADDSHQIAARSQVQRFQRVLVDRHAGDRHARRIGQRQIALVDHALGRRDGDFPRIGETVIVEGALDQMFVHF